MHAGVLTALEFAQGPLFRFAFALLVFGLVRLALLGLSDVVAAYVTTPSKPVFWSKVRDRVLWITFPSLVLRKYRPGGSRGQLAYHLGLCVLSLILRAGAILVPAFMAAHVYLWVQAFGIGWPALPKLIADWLSVITIVAGLMLFFGRLYSPVVRRIEPAWSFLKPLILILPFATGFLAMHPRWSPLDYHFVMLLHVVTACLVFAMIPFARLLSCMHTPITDVIPETAWQPRSADPQPSEPSIQPTPVKP